jgi:hypothetical protein
VNVKQLVESSIYYAKSQNDRRLIGEIAEDLDSFAQETGVDPVHEMSYLVVSDKLTIAIGKFNTKKIKRYVQSRGNIDELKYGGVSPGAGFFLRKQIAFLSNTEIALGESISILNTFNAKTGSNVLSNPFMNSLIQSIPPNAMFWYVDNSPYLLDKSPVPIPVGNYKFKGVAGAFSFTNALTGRVAILIDDLNTADELPLCYMTMRIFIAPTF